MWKSIRIGVLLFLLATVAQSAWRDARDATDWVDPLIVVLYPINADDSDAARNHIDALALERFQPIAAFMREQARGYGVGVGVREPVDLRLAPPVVARPPQPPAAAGALGAIAWSLRFRYWVWRHDSYQGARANVRLFLLYHDGGRSPRLPHSTGLEKGLIGLVNVFADDAMAGANQVVIVHELLHTLGATDKYDRATNMPIFPHGYAEPDRMPTLPQSHAEIMAGRIPIGSLRADQAESLDEVLVGPLTAREIGWAPR